MIALAATLVGCSRQPSYQAATGTAAHQPIEFASLKTDPPTETKLKNEKPPPLRVRDRVARFIAKKAKPASIRAKTEPTATRVPLPPPSLRTQLEPKSKADADLGTIGQPTVGLFPNSKSRTMKEQVAAATEVAERMTDNVPTDLLVAVVMARPQIKSVADLAGKSVAMDERYSASSVDVWVGFVVAGVSVKVSAGYSAAIDRLSNGEVTAAVLALVSPDAADGFPEIAGYKIFRVPLWPYASKARP
ncbi:hypothetical protein QA640_17255 [Bradyrhizobium sp. CB82]|uniref:hypothetical protein n=1 Tax=Bradyrhizobium sp. CB82 TaxID=3039159 RepID=UPI0024B0E322|nr:hypothetical protein [Bradyrhizobium sp. CB82]WFU44036.1 hypothetical protein QA640_17255 [Bradyrhizobium sp. CB82]